MEVLETMVPEHYEENFETGHIVMQKIQLVEVADVAYILAEMSCEKHSPLLEAETVT